MSRTLIFKNGTVAAQPFSASLSEVAMTSSKKQKQDPLKVVMEEARERGFSAGQAEGFDVGRTAGYQAGFEQAYAEAANQKAEALRAFMADLQNIHGQIEASMAEWFENSERELEVLGLQIAEHLLNAQLQLDRSIVIETTKNALRQVTDASQVRIRVNPFDSVILASSRDEVLAASATLRGVEIVGDDSIQAGCVIETDRGVVDATVDTRLELMRGGLEEAA